MKNKFITYVVITALGLSVSYIFIAGNLKYEQASAGTTNIGFASGDQTISIKDDNFQALDLEIENRNSEKQVYTLSFLISEQEITKESVSVTENQRVIIKASAELKDFLKKTDTDLKGFKYGIKINWNNREEVLHKRITLNP